MANKEAGEDQIILTLEDNSEMVCDVIGIFDYEGREYICLLPVEDPDGDFILYRYSEDAEGEPVLDDMDDDEFDAVSEYFWEMVDEENLDEFFDDEDEEE